MVDGRYLVSVSMGISVVKVGLLFSPKIEGQNLQKIIIKEIRVGIRLKMTIKDALSIYLLEYLYYNFMMRFRVKQFQNCKKLYKKPKL